MLSKIHQEATVLPITFYGLPRIALSVKGDSKGRDHQSTAIGDQPRSGIP